jgi:hypothetical protein
MKLETFSYTAESGWSSNRFPELDSSQTLIIVFGSPDLIDRPAPIMELANAYPNSHIVGCSSAGEIFGVDIFDDSLVAAAVKFDRAEVDTAVVAIGSPTYSYSAGKALAKKLIRPDLRGVLIFSDGIHVNGTELIRGFNSILPESVIVTGGLAGDGSRFKRTWIISERAPYSGAVSAVGLYGESLSIGYGSGGGWDMFGPERVVTHSEGNILYELDGRPALQLYKEYLGGRASGLPATGLLFPLALRSNSLEEKRLVRTILAIDEERQSMIFAGDIPQGALAQLMTANFDRLIQGAENAARMAWESVKEETESLCIAISCVGRRLLLTDRIEEETEAILDILPPKTKQIGFYAYGEIAPYANGHCDLHNQTMTLTVISESSRVEAIDPQLKSKLEAEQMKNFLQRRKMKSELAKSLHLLLRRQLKKVGITDPLLSPSEETWQKVVKHIGQYYDETDHERDTLNRSLDLCSKEMQTLYKSLAEKVEELAKKNDELAKKNEELIESYRKANRIFTALAESLPGKILDGKYRLDTKIGAGGYGAVYKSTHLGLNHSVAVKVFLPAEGNATMENLDRFRLEGISACRVHHPNAVSVLDSGISSEGIAYLVMELLEGRSLADELLEKDKLSVKRCAEILIPVCNALDEAHQVGIVHRDIKPDNIFLHRSKDGEVVKVVDFGIAKLMDNDGITNVNFQALKTMNVLIGTPTYMSPERINNEPYDGRSDVYSLGVMMYEMLCGQVPFDHDLYGIAAVMFMHLKADPRPLSEYNPDVPEAVEAIVMQALSKDPSKRPTAKELGEEFAQAMEEVVPIM